MSLSPYACPFYPSSLPPLNSSSSCLPSSSYALSKRDFLLQTAGSYLSKFDLNLLSMILAEWESSNLLSSCFEMWSSHSQNLINPTCQSLQVLSFNVRGFDLRWQEVLLLSSSTKADILILQETGTIDLTICEKAFPDHKKFYQRGENRNGGVLILVHRNVPARRVEYNIPNVCGIDLLEENGLRIIGVYAPDSRSWDWDDLTPSLTKNCIIFGDFNVDIYQDSTKATKLINWADRNSLAPWTPDSPTSRRSNRVIDFAFARGINLSIQTYSGNTTSDHLPLLSVIPVKSKQNTLGKNTHWNVFTSIHRIYLHLLGT